MAFHVKKHKFKPNKQVRIRFLYNQVPPYNFYEEKLIERPNGARKVKMAIIHFHGGGFIC